MRFKAACKCLGCERQSELTIHDGRHYQGAHQAVEVSFGLFFLRFSRGIENPSQMVFLGEPAPDLSVAIALLDLNDQASILVRLQPRFPTHHLRRQRDLLAQQLRSFQGLVADVENEAWLVRVFNAAYRLSGHGKVWLPVEVALCPILTVLAPGRGFRHAGIEAEHFSGTLGHRRHEAVGRAWVVSQRQRVEDAHQPEGLSLCRIVHQPL